MKKNILFYSLVLLMFASGCRTTLEPEKPSERYLSWAKEPEASFIQVPVNIEISTLERLINTKLKGLLYDNPSIKIGEESTIAIKVWKSNRILLNMEGNSLEWEIPLKIQALTRMRIGLGSIGFTDTRELNGEIALKYKTAIEIMPDWAIKTQTTPVSYTWIKEPVMKAGNKELPITLLANIILNNTQQYIHQSIDENLQQNLNLRSEAEKLWQKLQEPVKIFDSPEIWLRLKPEEVYALQPTTVQGLLQWKAALKARVDASIGTKPEVGPPIALKKINLWMPKTPSSYLFARINTNLDSLASTAQRLLKNEKFTNGSRSITIKSIKLYGSEGMLVAETTVEGSVNGKIYFKGKPYYDNETQQLRVQDFDFDLKTQNLLHKSAAWLLQSSIKKPMASFLTYNLGDQIKSIQKGIDNWTKNFEPIEGVKIKGSIEKLAPEGIHISPEAVVVYLKGIGNIEIISRPVSLK